MGFRPCADDVFFRRNDVLDPRWGERVLRENDSNADWVIRGYPDDEGIRLNGGRPGAALGPEAIRRLFYKTTVEKNHPRLYDAGDLSPTGPLQERHQTCRSTLAELLRAQKRVCTLGGGHDYGFPDGAGFMDVYGQDDPIVINFDAHLDVRNLDRGLTSGTPFFRLLGEFPRTEFIEVGIQQQCNSEHHLQWCRDRHVKILSLSDILQSPRPLIEQLVSLTRLSLRQHRPAFVSLDIDCFANAEAPGCSQSWPTGLTANLFMPMLSQLMQYLDIKVFGIYEVSPPLDHDHRTAKLAAQALHTLLRGQY